MSRFLIVGGICAGFLMSMATMAVAQDEHKNERPGSGQLQNRQEQARPQEPARPDDRRNQEPQGGNRHEMTPQNGGRPAQQPQSGDRRPERRQDERQMQQPEQRQNMGEQQQREKDRHDQARPQREMQGNQHARAEGRERHERRIPEPDFRAHFGREHHFHPGRMQVYQGRPQFNYSGYVFELVEPWPEDWAYDQDDYYIDYMDDEYWLYSLDHPGVRLELIIVE
jgi:hypothetical protein